MDVRVDISTPSRPCKLCFGLQEDSVFADFDEDEKSQLYLVRISFDGYGCCYPVWGGAPVKMSLSDSQRLAQLIEANDLSHPDAASILSSYFVTCGEAVWMDALQAHGLI